MPTFSVIMPLYNKVPYVRKGVESVVGQTCRDWELIVVDDGSTDGGGDIVTAIDDPRIRLVRQENAGVGAARNRGVAESTSPYICFLDADDWWEPTFLEEMACMIERHPDAGIYGTSYWIVKNGRKRLAPIGVEEGFTEGEINYCQVYARTLCMPLTSITVCIPRRVFDEAGGFPTDVRLGEDFLLWLRVALKHKVVLLNKQLANYNQDVDIAHRGTHHLHPPEKNMLWHLGEYAPLEATRPDYKQLVDNLRCYSLMGYLLDRRHRSAARAELAKVDWSRQPAETRRLFRQPVWMLQLRRHVLKTGSCIKQHLKR
ncbi:MAG: glycosyltransferase family 2 protein [Bacteroidales bacterium]|nr:glycosyltransferase family 2 protein [Bacteroidales bacterium]